ncbi:hypothetical protein [Streptomyces sp. MJM8645]|uniref:hypothetical protein n=1 Tax=Streptomycetaceae TaxID=2062 RepID=UPI0007AF2D06|nr:hypothetical protein [Streptomyces sp. MJM8645]
MRTLADAFGTDVEIVRRSDAVVRAYCRTGAPEEIHDVLRQCGFTASDPHGSCCYHLPADTPGADQPAAASTAATLLDDAGYRVGIDPHPVVGYVGQNCIVQPEEQRLAATRRTSAAAKAAPAQAGTPAVVPVRPGARTR